MTTTKKPAKEKLVGFRMPAAKHLALRILALKQGRSIAVLINEALDAHFKLGKKK